MASFAGNGAKLVGNDGTVFRGVIGAEVEGDGIVVLAAGTYIITAVDASTAWPSASGATGAVDIEVGYLIEGGATTPIVPAVGDKYVPLTLTELCDISQWGLDYAADEIDVTTFCNSQKRYEKGKTDVQGSLSGIVTVGVTDAPNTGLLQEFMDIVRQSDGDEIDLHKQLSGEIFVKLAVNADTNKADPMFYFAPVNLYGFSLGGSVGAEASSFESPMRISTATAGAADVEINPAFYRVASGT